MYNRDLCESNNRKLEAALMAQRPCGWDVEAAANA